MAILPRIGISRCLLGDNVRYDGAHKRDSFLLEILGPQVEWVPVCPEVELGLGTPREAMRLAGDPRVPRLVTITSGIDHTEAMARFSQRRVRELEALNLSGYVFKARSPSCGIGGGSLETGLFAQAFMAHFPLMPVEDEDHLHDLQAVQSFLERARGYRLAKNPRPLREREG